MRASEDHISKRLDVFIVVAQLVHKLNCVRQWVRSGSDSDHSPNFLEIKGPGKKPPNPFKFNYSLLKDEYFKDLFIKTGLANYKTRFRVVASVHFSNHG